MSITDNTDEYKVGDSYLYTSKITENSREQDPIHYFKNKYKVNDGTVFIIRDANYEGNLGNKFVLLDSIKRENGLTIPQEIFNKHFINQHFTKVTSGGRKITRKRKRRLFKNKNFRKTRKTIKRH